jgi:hypothetical protein
MATVLLYDGNWPSKERTEKVAGRPLGDLLKRLADSGIERVFEGGAATHAFVHSCRELPDDSNAAGPIAVITLTSQPPGFSEDHKHRREEVGGRTRFVLYARVVDAVLEPDVFLSICALSPDELFAVASDPTKYGQVPAARLFFRPQFDGLAALAILCQGFLVAAPAKLPSLRSMQRVVEALERMGWAEELSDQLGVEARADVWSASWWQGGLRVGVETAGADPRLEPAIVAELGRAKSADRPERFVERLCALLDRGGSIGADEASCTEFADLVAGAYLELAAVLVGK